MKRIKNIIAILVPVLLLAVTISIPVSILSGCAGLQEPTSLQRVTTAAKVAAFVGSAEYIRSHPGARPTFEAARNQLVQMEQSEHIDLATLLAIVTRLPVQELKSEHARILITAATIIISDYGASLPIDQLENLRPVARAIREGIDLALTP